MYYNFYSVNSTSLILKISMFVEKLYDYAHLYMQPFYLKCHLKNNMLSSILDHSFKGRRIREYVLDKQTPGKWNKCFQTLMIIALNSSNFY